MSDETLEWDLSVDADTSGGTRLDAMLGRLESQFEQANRQLVRMELASHRAGNAHGEHEKHAEGLRGAFGRLITQGLDPFLHKAKEIAEFEFIREGTERLLELPMKLAEGIKDLGEEMIMTAAKAERFDMAFSNAVGKDASEHVLGYIGKIGKHTEFTQEQLKGMNLELAKAGYKGNDLAKATAAMIDLGSMSANPQEGASRAMSALERVRVTGKMEGRALVPFGISEQSLLDEVGKETGMSSKGGVSAEGGKVASQVEKALQAGRVPIETELNSLYTLITKKTGKALGGAGADMEATLSAKMTHLHELPELYFEKLKDTSGYQRVSEQVSKLLDGLDPESARGRRIFATLETALEHISLLMENIDLAGVIEKGIDALDLFATEFVDLLSVLPGETGRKAGHLAAEMKERRLADARHRGEEEAEAASAERMKAMDKDSSQATAGFFKDFPAAERAAAMRKGMYSAEDDETPFLVKGIEKSKGEFESAGAEAGEAVERGTRKATRTHSPSEAYFDIGRDLAAGITKAGDDFEGAGESAGMAIARGTRGQLSDDGADMVDRAIDQMAGNSIGLGRPAAGAPTIVLHISPQIYINGEGVDADAIVKEAVDRLTEIVPGVVQSAFEQVALQGGPVS